MPGGSGGHEQLTMNHGATSGRHVFTYVMQK
jgi:hypothetical protein